MIGRCLGQLFVRLLVSTKIGVQAEWVLTRFNFTADGISCLKDEYEDGKFDYAELKSTHAHLAVNSSLQKFYLG